MGGDGRTTKSQTEATAQEILRNALDAQYRFPDSFPGFTATISAIKLATDSQESLSGTVTITGARTIEMEADGAGELNTWVMKEFHSMMGFRWREPYQYADNTLTMEGDPASLQGCVITVTDDAFKSVYRIRSGKVLEWSNTLGLVKNVRRIMCSMHLPDGRVLPETSSVVYWSTMTDKMLSAETYSDRCEMVNDIVMPASRKRVFVSEEEEALFELQISNWNIL